MQNKKNSKMFNIYLLRFVFRCIIFIFVLFMYIFNRQWFYDLIFEPFIWEIAPFHILWAIFMAIMLVHIFPNSKITMAERKTELKNYDKVENYDELALYKYVQEQNIRAWKVMLIWLCVHAVIGILYLAGLIGEVDLWMLTVFYYCGDLVCIMAFCPFQTFLMKSHCCINCRIFDWGHFMMFSPMIFINGFFTWSLFFTGLIVFVKWEISYTKHPERFWSGSNKTLQCRNCNDQLCRMKKTFIFRKLNQLKDKL